MFHSARITLTAWYLLIIMAVSVTFSVVIYRVLVGEVERFDRVRTLRMEYRIKPVAGQVLPLPPPNPELIEETKQRIITFLVLINAGILVLSGGLGYFLAGRTLAPIGEMMDTQNRFIADVSHELKTPLTSLKTAFEVFLRNKHRTLPESETLASESIEEVNRLQSLAESMLELSNYENPNQSLYFEKLNIAKIINDAIRRVGPMAKEKKIVIENNIKPLIVEGNSTRLTELFVILLDNAIKYSPVQSTVALETEKNDGNIRISVIDHGAGIGKKDLPHIFDRFYRADTARSKTGTGGYGLGLSIGKKIVAMHNGLIHAESKLKKGTTFTVLLPVRHG